MFRIDRYVVTEQIYAGTGAVLYRGYRDDDGAHVTVKLPPGEYPDPSDVARIRHEYAILKDIDVPGVARALDLMKHRNALALVLADDGGRPLVDVMKEGRLDVGTALRLAISLAGTVDALHRRRIVHKDIKPHNLLVDGARSRITLFDFGIATRLSQEVQRAPVPQALEGTLAYISPEQTGRVNRVIDSRTDLYSIGVTLYEMLAGALPFSSSDALELVHCHIARTPSPLKERAPEVPEAVSDIVMKLLSKAAEDRYQGAGALRRDLERCLRGWDEAGAVTPFPLGEADPRDRVRLPQRLHEREPELASLAAAFERSSDGAAELVLIRGGAGVGKSALANEMRRLSASRRGYFIAGKFDPPQGRSAPYAAVARAFGDLARQILAQRGEVSARIARDLAAAVSPNGQALTEIIPELGPLLGAQPAIPPLGPAESQNRLMLALQRALRVVATADHPLALCLDDLQWADAASLRLLEAQLTDPESSHLLVIGAYRDAEVDDAHPLALARREVERRGGAVVELALAPLSRAGAGRFVADALGCPAAEAAPLAELLDGQAQGNPFFLGQLLAALEAEGLIAFDPRAGRLAWDLEQVRERLDTGDVLVVLTRRIKRLTPETQRLLALAACIGAEFSLEPLVAIGDRDPRALAAGVWEALSEGLLVALDGGYSALDSLTGPAGGAALPAAQAGSFGFAHERVHQAAYELLGAEERRAVHLRVGRHLRDKAPPDGGLGDGELFELVRHLNQGAALLEDPAERLELARLDLAAGKRARGRMASAAAEEILAAGAALLPPGGAGGDEELAFALRLLWAECALLSGKEERAELLFDDLLARARSLAERADIHSLRATLHVGAGRPAEALRAGLAGLAHFGIAAPEDDAGWQAALAEQMALVEKNLAGRSIASVVDAPELASADDKALLRLLMNVYVPGWVVSTTIGFFFLTKLVNTCLERGHSEVAPFAYGTYSFLLAGAYGRYRQSYEFGELALALAERFPSPELLCKLYLNTGVPLVFSRPLRAALARLGRAVEAGFTTGDLTYLSYAVNNALTIRLGMGDDLGAVFKQAGEHITLTQRTRDVMSERMIRLTRQMAACLLGLTRDEGSLSDGAFDEAEALAEAESSGVKVHVYYQHVLCGQALFLRGDHRAALEHVLAAEEVAAYASGLYIMTELPLLACLTLAALCDGATSGDRARHEAMIAAQRDKLARWAEGCPENFRHKLLLVDAELARVRGDDTAATDGYEAALAAARESGIGRDEALANELAAKYHLARGRPKIARGYMTDAYYGYFQWGATTKVRSIAADHPGLLVRPAAPARADADQKLTSSTVTIALRTSSYRSTTGHPDVLDLEMVMKAAHAIAGELVLDRVLDRMMRIIAESAGAQRGVLLLDREGEIAPEAAISFGPAGVALDRAAPAAAAVDYSRAIVDRVAHAGRTLVLDDASASSAFSDDPYIARHRVRSVLCLALKHQGRRTGVLYLENNVASSVFTPARVELCSLLASQAAIAVENARLYAHVQSVTDELRRSNEILESNVQRRTEELRQANEQLTIELSERARAEKARAILQEEVIRAQRERLAELSTPLLPIAEGVVVMPLIGTLDADRAAQMQEAALRGAADVSARTVILDITGIRTIDTAVAGTLLRTTAALRLLGAQAVITGVRADVAQTLVALGIDLTTVLTFGTLRSGIAYALVRAGGGGKAAAVPVRQAGG
ncbi:protein kinase domain-containing protein [Sorangium sp. So ce1389]|uniref:protein kinase domain-containing protein n=1 Tax=Sorangium sp. So ce1389 TaxID=3133336 RepID=UPI003F60293C